MSFLPRCLALLLLLPQCGGGGPTGSGGDAKSADDAATTTTDDAGSDEQSASDEGDGDGDGDGAEKSKAATCDDGTCSACGDGMCPSGWYCDEKAAACSWLTECADKPTCGCVTRVLGSACKCREESGGLKVACD